MLRGIATVTAGAAIGLVLSAAVGYFLLPLIDDIGGVW